MNHTPAPAGATNRAWRPSRVQAERCFDDRPHSPTPRSGNQACAGGIRSNVCNDEGIDGLPRRPTDAVGEHLRHEAAGLVEAAAWTAPWRSDVSAETQGSIRISARPQCPHRRGSAETLGYSTMRKGSRRRQPLTWPPPKPPPPPPGPSADLRSASQATLLPPASAPGTRPSSARQSRRRTVRCGSPSP